MNSSHSCATTVSYLATLYVKTHHYQPRNCEQSRREDLGKLIFAPWLTKCKLWIRKTAALAIMIVYTGATTKPFN